MTEIKKSPSGAREDIPSGSSLPLAGSVRQAGNLVLTGPNADEAYPIDALAAEFSYTGNVPGVVGDAGVFTYDAGAAAIRVLVRVYVSSGIPGGGASYSPFLVIAHNADVVGVGGSRPQAGYKLLGAIPDTQSFYLATERLVDLAPGDTVQAALGTLAGKDFPISGYNMTLVQVAQ